MWMCVNCHYLWAGARALPIYTFSPTIRSAVHSHAANFKRFCLLCFSFAQTRPPILWIRRMTGTVSRDFVISSTMSQKGEMMLVMMTNHTTFFSSSKTKCTNTPLFSYCPLRSVTNWCLCSKCPGRCFMFSLVMLLLVWPYNEMWSNQFWCSSVPLYSHCCFSQELNHWFQCFMVMCIGKNLAVRYVSWCRGNDMINHILLILFFFPFFDWGKLANT